MRASHCLAVALWCGCSGSHSGNDGGGTPDGGGPTVTASNVCSTVAQRICTLLTGCGYVDPSEQSACVTVETAACGVNPAKVAEGLNGFDQARAQACVNALAAEPGCTDRLSWLLLFSDSCALPFATADAGIGAPCEDGDCAQGFCPPGGGACQVCTPYVALGRGPCSFDINQCDPSTGYCNDLVPDGGLCAAWGKGGDPCDFFFQCLSGICNQSLADGGSICGTLQGDVCASDSDCDRAGYYCKIAPAAGQGTCEHLIPTGSPCGADSVTGCASPAVCLQSTCTVVPPLSLARGATCTTSIQCQEGLYCNNVNQTCIAQLDAGDTCPQPEACPPFAMICAQATTNTCVPLQPPGQSCTDTTCRLFEDCANPDGGAVGTCLTAGQPGDWCGTQRSCSPVDAFCFSPDGGAGSCAPLKDAGTPCDPNALANSCASGLCGPYQGVEICQPQCL